MAAMPEPNVLVAETEERRAGRSRVDRSSVLIYAGLIAFVVAVKVAFTLWPVALASEGQASDLTWAALTVFALLGGVGVALLRPGGFPGAWDREISLARRILLPLGMGVGAGLLLRLLNRVHSFGLPNVAFPMSVLLYPLGAVLVQIQLRLFPAPLLVWLIGVLLLRRRWPNAVFWCVALGLSVVEPLMQQSGLPPMPLAWTVVLMLFVGLENLGEMLLFRRAGFLAPLTMRLGFYAIWHILRG
jgi:hypothetical protein